MKPQSRVADQAIARRVAPGPSAKLLGKNRIYDTVFDPAQSRYMDLVQSLNTLRDNGFTKEADAIAARWLERLYKR